MISVGAREASRLPHAYARCLLLVSPSLLQQFVLFFPKIFFHIHIVKSSQPAVEIDTMFKPCPAVHPTSTASITVQLAWEPLCLTSCACSDGADWLAAKRYGMSRQEAFPWTSAIRRSLFDNRHLSWLQVQQLSEPLISTTKVRPTQISPDAVSCWVAILQQARPKVPTTTRSFAVQKRSGSGLFSDGLCS